MGDLNVFYENEFASEAMPPFEELTEKQKNILSSSFAFTAYQLNRAAKQLENALLSIAEATKRPTKAGQKYTTKGICLCSTNDYLEAKSSVLVVKSFCGDDNIQYDTLEEVSKLSKNIFVIGKNGDFDKNEYYCNINLCFLCNSL